MKNKLISIILMVIVLVTMIPSIKVFAATEDFTTYYEYDPYSVFTKNVSTISWTTLKNSSSTPFQQVTKDYSNTPVTSGFDMKFAYSLTADYSASGSAELYIGMFSNNTSIVTAGNYGNISLYHAGGSNYSLLCESYNGTLYFGTSYTLTIGATYYIDLFRDTQHAHLQIYSDSGYTNLVHSSNITLHGTPTLNYSGMVASVGARSATYQSGYITGLTLVGISYSIPSVLTAGHFNETSTNVTLQGMRFNIGSSNITKQGFDIGLSSGSYFMDIIENGDWNTTGDSGYFNSSTGNMTSPLLGNTTYYYRAKAYNSSGWGYGIEDTFSTGIDPVVQTIGVTNSQSNGVVTYTFTGNLVSSNTTPDIFGVRGFNIGLSSGSWIEGLKLDEIANGASLTSWNGSLGYYTLSTTYLSANTTYYYQAYGETSNDIGTWYFGLGDILSFTTLTTGNSGIAPLLTTNSVQYWNSNLTISGYLATNGGSNIIERGIRVGLSQATIHNLSSDTGTSIPLGSFTKTTSYNQAGGIPYPAGTHLYCQVFAVNANGQTGYGNIIDYVIPVTNIGAGGLMLVNKGVTPQGNTALIGATITNPSNIDLDYSGFSWGLTASASDTTFNGVISGTPSEINYSINNLTESRVYWFKCGVHPVGGNSWVWSTPTAFTTGTALPNPVGGSPIVETTAPSNISSTYFTANGNLISAGSLIGSAVSQIGFAWSYDRNTDITQWQIIKHTENAPYSLGAYTETLSFSRSNITIYYAFYAKNQYNEIFGNIYPVMLNQSGGGGGTTTTPSIPTQPVTAPISNWVLWLATIQGLDNPFGHWAFLLETMVLILLFYGIFIFVFIHYNMIQLAKITGVIMGISELIDFGAFIFTGWLGIWPVIFLGGGVIAMIVIVIAIFGNKGGGG